MKSWIVRAVFAVLLVSALAAPAAAQSGLLAGDVVRVAIWREEELSGEFPVGLDGNATFPLLGTRHVVGIPLDSLQAQLQDAYRVYLRNPAITVTPLRRVQVLGEVAKPGLYTVDATVSVAGAVATAGGATPAGDLRRIRLVRDGHVYSQRVSPETALSAADIRSGDQIFVGTRNWLERNGTLLVSVLLSATGIIVSLLTRP
ncbi:MAG TPA: polysaccharide biosynthesis/export family protein [Longimicrobium sp.]|jgi:polysaccharide export outer membrane protein|uniref:polysaccharide biosynthesis/export family protein n=1 Tax=Longimicrobium sp. TaxID=2029185 RepID=UPI002EDB3A8A